METLQLVCRASGKRIGTFKTVFVVRGVGVFRKSQIALKAAKGTLRLISVVAIGKLYDSQFAKKKKSTRLEVKNYPFLKRDEFARDFGIKNFSWR